MTDPLGNPYYFSYDLRGDQTYRALAGGLAESLHYDAVGNLAHDSIYQSTAGVIRNTRLTYDARNKLLTSKDPTAFADTTLIQYSGLGHLLSSHVSQTATNGMGGTGYGATLEALSHDAVGNALETTTIDTVHKTVLGSAFNSVTTSHDSTTLDAYWRVQSALGSRVGVTTIRTYHYDEDGNTTFYLKRPSSLGAAGFREDRYSFYDAEGVLRAADYRTVEGASGSVPDIVLEEYRYDALGRRYSVRADKFCGDVPQFMCGLSTLRRTLWDGNQELMEIQVPVKIPLWYTSDDTLLNNDQYVPRLPMLGTRDYNPYSGRVLYIPGTTLDQPVGMVRYNYVNRLPDTGAPPESLLVMPTAAMSLVWNAKGRVDMVWCSTGAQRCTGNREVTGTSARQAVNLPEQTFFVDRPRFANLSWQGTLIHDKADEARTNCRRNRYYDPASGQFTQEDPIGLAGGLNLYGFAGGDPVNFSDPFGLCPIEVDGIPCAATFGLGGLLGGALVGGVIGATGGTFVIPGVGTVVGGAGGALAGGIGGGVSGVLAGLSRDIASVFSYKPGAPFTPKAKTIIDREATEATGQEGVSIAVSRQFRRLAQDEAGSTTIWTRDRKVGVVLRAMGVAPVRHATKDLAISRSQIHGNLPKIERKEHAMTSAENSLIQVDFTSPEGRKERLWAASIGIDQARILSVPVWIYGVSVGSIVHTGTNPPRVIRTSPGATLRLLVAEGMNGKHVYLTRVVPDLRERNWGIGPATFFGPRLVALNVHNRASWWPEIGGYLDGLISGGVLEQWEAGDPDQGADQESTAESSSESVLVHPLPVDGITDLEFS